MSAPDLDDFRTIYERHVGYVKSGDMKAAISDMVQENLATVFDGVEVPRAVVDRAQIVSVHADGDTRVGETVYHVADGVIGLRSIWELHGDKWLAARLENFTPASGGDDA